MQQLKRIELIYNYLKQNKGSYNDIKKFLYSWNIDLGIRQIQRDVKELPILIKASEKLIKKRTSEKIIIFYIISTKESIKNEDNEYFYIDKSNFFEIIDSDKIKPNLKIIGNAISNNQIIKIKKLKNDITGDNYNFDSTNILFMPLKIIKHRGSYYIGGYNTKKQTYQIFDISQLKDISFTEFTEVFEKKDHLIIYEEEMIKRFGITKNFDNNVYKIVIEFTSITGNFIKEHFWHQSQKFRKKGNIIEMEITSGINRELIGWLFYWMYNCKVKEPQILKDLYTKTTEEIIKVIKNKKPLVYKNIFTENK
ncbi:WYL domain-containing protein [Flavobacterium sp.]|jgi:hypothetical protein|uniref:WYL domain-containing protein n=1 Tax=Flavobacterium sp. TaxID=239 RepID=UPI0037C1701F